MMQAYEIIEHSYDVVIMGAGGRDCELHWEWREYVSIMGPPLGSAKRDVSSESAGVPAAQP
jgi:hypothetical protein